MQPAARSEVANSKDTAQKLFKKEEMTFRYSDRIAPVLANGRIYCRNQNGFIVCLDVGGK